LVSNGCRGASSDEATITGWFEHHPEANIAVATGNASGVWAIDLDGRGGHLNWQALELEHSLVETLSQRSGRIEPGSHLFFRMPDGAEIGNSTGKLAPGIDVRGTGGYVVATPSRHISGRTYSWITEGNPIEAPPWLLGLVGSKPVEFGPREPERVASISAYVRAAVENEIAELGRTVEPGRNDQLNRSAFALGQLAPFLIEHEVRARLRSTALRIGLPEGDTDRTIESGWTSGRGEPRTLIEDAPRARQQAPAMGPGASFSERCFADIESTPISWLWPSRVAFGKLTLLDGLPGIGKSTVAYDLAARLSSGRPPPCSDVPLESRTALILAAEDDPADTVRPRLELARANLHRVRIVDHVETTMGPRLLMFPIDADRLEKRIRELGAGLVLIDSFMSTIAAHDTHRAADVLGALLPLKDVAQRTGCAIVAIRHWTKGSGGSALSRGMGSQGIAGLARTVLCAGKSPDDETAFVLASVKSNVAGACPSLGYRLVAQGQHCGVQWMGPVATTAEDLAAVANHGGETSAIDEARTFVVEALGTGPLSSVALAKQARDLGISERTVERVRRQLRVVSTPVRNDAGRVVGWDLSLPSSSPPSRPTTSVLGGLDGEEDINQAESPMLVQSARDPATEEAGGLVNVSRPRHVFGLPGEPIWYATGGKD
jgi:hypothetical protein